MKEKTRKKLIKDLTIYIKTRPTIIIIMFLMVIMIINQLQINSNLKSIELTIKYNSSGINEERLMRTLYMINDSINDVAKTVYDLQP